MATKIDLMASLGFIRYRAWNSTDAQRMSALMRHAHDSHNKGTLQAELTYRAPAPKHPLPKQLAGEMALCSACLWDMPLSKVGKHSREVAMFFGFNAYVTHVNYSPELPRHLWADGDYIPCDRCFCDTGGEFAAVIRFEEAWNLYSQPEPVRNAIFGFERD